MCDCLLRHHHLSVDASTDGSETQERDPSLDKLLDPVETSRRCRVTIEPTPPTSVTVDGVEWHTDKDASQTNPNDRPKEHQFCMIDEHHNCFSAGLDVCNSQVRVDCFFLLCCQMLFAT